MGRKKKAKYKKHNFKYRGLIVCGECGCLYTAQEKKKIIKKTGEIRKYIYYSCTRKKKDINCSQRKSIREDRLEEMIKKEISKYEIMPEFRDWTLDALKKKHKEEVRDRNKIIETRRKTYNMILKKIDRLVDMKLNEQITDGEYETKRNSLVKDKERINKELDQSDTRADRWLELTEKAFYFITNLTEAFNKGDFKLKASILRTIGKHISIKDEKLTIIPSDWLLPIKEEYPALEKEYLKLETAKKLAYSGVSSIPEPICNKWRGY